MPEYDATAVDATAGPGATAVLHGMLSTLTEVLDGLDQRLAGMEAAMEAGRLEPLIERVARLEQRLDDRLAEVTGGRERTAEALAAIGSGVGHLAARLDQLADVGDEPESEPDRIGPLAESVQGLERAVADVARRIEALPVVDLRPLEERLASLATSVDAVGFGVAGLADALRPDAGDDEEEPDVVGAVTREAEHVRALLEDHAAGVREEVTRLDTLLRGQVAEVAGRAGSITDVIGRLDGRLHEVVDGVRALQRRADAPVRLTAVGDE